MEHSPLFKDARPFRVQRFFSHKRLIIAAAVVLGVAACGAVLGPGFVSGGPSRQVTTVNSPDGSQGSVRSGLQGSGSVYHATARGPASPRAAGRTRGPAASSPAGKTTKPGPSASLPPLGVAAVTGVRSTPTPTPTACRILWACVRAALPAGQGQPGNPHTSPAGPDGAASPAAKGGPKPKSTATTKPKTTTTPKPTPKPTPTVRVTPAALPTPTARPSPTPTATLTPTPTATPKH